MLTTLLPDRCCVSMEKWLLNKYINFSPSESGLGKVKACQSQHRSFEMSSAVDPVIINLTVFVLAVVVGYHVVWNVTPALHTPLMAVTNAISGIIIVGAMLAAGPEQLDAGTVMGLIAVMLAAVNVFGGFLVTQRMLSMFKKKSK